MTIQGAMNELINLLKADDIPIYYKGGIKKVIETIDGYFNDEDDYIKRKLEEVKVVRCKVCRWYKKWGTIGRDDGYCGYARMTRDGLQYINTNADDFCSFGERSE